jgi:sec-independent protein translocase protein TatA
MPGFSELIVILVIVLVIFGAGKLPQIGDALGRGIRNFKKATNGADEIEVTPKREVTSGTPAAHARSDEGGSPKA